MRPIDADALKKKATMLEKELRPMVSSYCMGVTVWDIDGAPTIDAVPVVRCKDCKHWSCFMNNPDGTLFGNCEAFGNSFRDEGDFCSYGERKDGADVQDT